MCIRDRSTGNTQTAVTFDGLLEAKYAIKQQYWRELNWVMHRDAAKMLAKIKDSDGQYIWQPSVQLGQPDLLLGVPVRMSEYAPNTFTAGKYVEMCIRDRSNTARCTPARPTGQMQARCSTWPWP